VGLGVVAASPWIIPLVAGVSALAAAGGYLGWWWLNDQDTPDEINRSTDEEIESARNMEKEPLEKIHPRLRPYARDLRPCLQSD
jgi:hypothetical protein